MAHLCAFFPSLLLLFLTFICISGKSFMNNGTISQLTFASRRKNLPRRQSLCEYTTCEYFSVLFLKWFFTGTVDTHVQIDEIWYLFVDLLHFLYLYCSKTNCTAEVFAGYGVCCIQSCILWWIFLFKLKMIFSLIFLVIFLTILINK